VHATATLDQGQGMNPGLPIAFLSVCFRRFKNCARSCADGN